MLKISNASNFRRTACGLCLVAGPLVALIGGVVARRESSESTAAYLRAMAESPTRTQISAVLLYFGYLLIAVGIFGIIHLLRRRVVVLGNIAGVLAVWGWVTLPGLLISDFYDLSLAQWGNQQDAISISERAGSYVGDAIISFSVLLGLIGLVLLGIALWRARFAPLWVPGALLAGTLMAQFGPSGAVSFAIGTGLWLAGLGYVGLKMLRMTDEDWDLGVG